MKQAGMTITYAGVDITQWMYVQMVKRDVGTNHVNAMQKVGISDGQMLQYMSRDVKTIVVTGIVMNDDLVPLRRALAAAIDTDEPQQLIFGDEPDKYYLAIVDSQPIFTEGFRSGTISISFICPDGIAHSVATKTFDNMPYKDIPLNLMAGTSADPVSITGSGWNIKELGSYNNPVVGQKYAATVLLGRADFAVSFQLWANDINGNRVSLAGFPVTTQMGANQRSTIVCTWPDPGTTGAAQIEVTLAWAFQKTDVGTYQYLKAKLEEGTTYSTWSPNPADPEYYSDTITVHNGGTYPVEPVITATMHADNGFLGFANSQGGVLQFGNPEEIDGYTSEESEVALNLAAVQGSHMDNQAASNNLYWGDNPATPNEQIGNAIWTQDSYDGWKVEPNWPSITGDHKYWNGPSIKHNLAQTHNGNFKSNLTWDVMTRFQTGVSQVGSLETTLESDGKPIFQMILKDNSALSDQIWWMCYYKNQLVVNEQLDRNIFTNDKFIQLELQKFGNSVVFRVSPWVGNRGRETTITRQFTFADAASVETKQFSAWFMRDKTWGESTMYLIASTIKWQNVSWYTDIKNRFSNGDVITVDVANTKTYFNGSEDRTLHTLGNQWDKFLLPPGDTIIQLMPSSWAQPFACEVGLKEAWL
ncbi:phage tail family protein [Lacticaseibacillus rhamnosus]|uniref:distal tail protein Dit n=1 Tax=Lacticaseibacillus rhamnosus TaxID=47715 RepID=UPI0022EC0CFD|nr:distal tail protein Dit [Lacticaseibacillus rhamnosus]MDA3725715.1 phage tail family protein [Lacticaseibacillus rhamnosus]MDA3736764.1 phage tail family protein [Lacticaseibacillus rhamnosus]MDA3741743.1 phage tail family protein [Lacticaseibacillus rhamnosus]MDA3744294.1 phage tail family protein [Lacticaseibacillus rhamnosus]MDA3750182.1 phage tail family protein [Lacticaseibacillus rhamnosus]